jgi:hypothetical protein
MEFTRIASEAEVEGRMSETSIFRNQLSRRTGLLLVLPISVCVFEASQYLSIFWKTREEKMTRAYKKEKDA